MLLLCSRLFPRKPQWKFHDYVGYTSPLILSTIRQNFPCDKVDKNIDQKEDRSLFYCETDKNIWDDYDPEESHGGYVGLQLIGRKFEEER
ncbi:hypothetical protein JCM33374_g4894 [Metschnikowia sp. JCM 33374]|nr:hypothetical protein JCM33374_g4894 [Metschnikowia sp. JCM 33374]